MMAVALVTASCATASGVARPAPFPSAPVPPGLVPAVPGPRPWPDAEAIVRTAVGLVGVPYQLGGETPTGGFDCSGFVRFVFLQHAIDLPRTVAEQVAVGESIELSAARAGDLLFFTTIAPGASHVGLVLGPDEFIHAPGNTSVVRIEALSPYWRGRIVAVKRVLYALGARI
jgi:cell wall-associated NlpC family hydrolase